MRTARMATEAIKKTHADDDDDEDEIAASHEEADHWVPDNAYEPRRVFEVALAF